MGVDISQRSHLTDFVGHSVGALSCFFAISPEMFRLRMTRRVTSFTKFKYNKCDMLCKHTIFFPTVLCATLKFSHSPEYWTKIGSRGDTVS